MNALLVSLLFSAVLYTEVAGWGCDRGWVPFCNHCYLFSRDTRSWYDAAYTCAALGGSLVSFDTPAELRWVKGYVTKLCSGNYWTGGNDIRHEGRWVWNPTNGQTINRDCTDWASGEPNSWRGLNQDCMLLWHHRSYQWDDEQCHLGKGYICEKYMFSEKVCSCRI
ncbi:perlucin-like protein [Pecten maximus]|uniref:perlucin-like protein n=1 Tax=Pecten maximus TaxID=6579 RepID=UPI001458EA1F|nr:perlucin-like protein [Pecten maximus]